MNVKACLETKWHYTMKSMKYYKCYSTYIQAYDISRLLTKELLIKKRHANNSWIWLLEWKVEKLKAILDEYLNKYTKLLNKNIDYYQIKKLSST